MTLDQHMNYSFLAGRWHDVDLFYLNIDVAIGTNIINATDEILIKLLDEYKRGWNKGSLYVKSYITKRQRKVYLALIYSHIGETEYNEAMLSELTRRVNQYRSKQQIKIINRGEG